MYTHIYIITHPTHPLCSIDPRPSRRERRCTAFWSWLNPLAVTVERAARLEERARDMYMYIYVCIYIIYIYLYAYIITHPCNLCAPLTCVLVGGSGGALRSGAGGRCRAGGAGGGARAGYVYVYIYVCIYIIYKYLYAYIITHPFVVCAPVTCVLVGGSGGALLGARCRADGAGRGARAGAGGRDRGAAQGARCVAFGTH